MIATPPPALSGSDSYARALVRVRDIVGPRGWIVEPHDLEPYLVEERGLYRGACDAVVRPGSVEEVAQVVAICAEAGIAVVPQGGNTGLCGGAVPEGGIVLCTTRLNRIRALDPLDRTITVEAGVILADVQRAADEAELLFPLSLGAEGSCRIGGNLATNAGGMTVVRYGNTRDLVLGLEVVLSDGRIWNGLRSLRKDNTGYDLKHLFLGSEGTLGIITAAVLKLFPKPRETVTAIAAMATVSQALALLSRIQNTCGDALSAFELIGRMGLDFSLKHVPGLKDPFAATFPFYTLISLTSARAGGGLRDALEGVLSDAFEGDVIADAVVAESEAQANAFWRIRESLPEGQKGEGASIKNDVSVPVSRVPEFLDQAGRAVLEAMPGIRVVAFGHLGDGNIHYNLTQPVGLSPQAFLAEWGRFDRLVCDIATGLGGSFSAEHGIGRLKTSDMRRYKSDVELDLMRAVKSALDPAGIMNPGKVIAR